MSNNVNLVGINWHTGAVSVRKSAILLCWCSIKWLNALSPVDTAAIKNRIIALLTDKVCGAIVPCGYFYKHCRLAEAINCS